MKKLLLLVCLLALPLSAAAEEESRTYVIRKGDTLWGISERFLKDTHYWPSLWSNNPDIRNPHFIYPGQKVRIYEGRIEILPAEGRAAGQTAAEGMAPPQPVAAVTVKANGAGASGFLSTEEFDASGMLLDTVDDRIMMAAGETVFVNLHNLSSARPGERFSLFALGNVITHPVSGEKVGHMVTNVGSLQVTEIHPEVATAVITSSDREIERGARLRPWMPEVREVALKKAAQPLSGVVLTGGDAKLALGQYDYLHIDLGARDGLETGNLLYVTRPRTATELGLQGEGIQLPEVILGTAVVIDTQTKTATALILKIANQPIERGDRVSTAD